MISSDIGKEIIKKQLPLIPKLPGVYRMLSGKGEILYVGKARNLPNRLKSYVTEKNHIIRTDRMLSQTRKLEITTTSNESEALLLEANLIKKHKPKFNILLRDDKSFPFIFIGNKDDWPQIKRHRGKKTKEGFYFGPFASAGSANWTIKMIQKIFHLRVCDDTVFKNRERPCILYQIKRCSGPCVGYIEKNEYKKTVDDMPYEKFTYAGPIIYKSHSSSKYMFGRPVSFDSKLLEIEDKGKLAKLYRWESKESEIAQEQFLRNQDEDKESYKDINSSLTILEINLPSALPFNLGITAPIVIPKSEIPAGFNSAIISFTSI